MARFSGPFSLQTVAKELSMSDSSASSASSNRERMLEQQTFDAWPQPLRMLFDGTSLAAKMGFTASLVTVNESGSIRTSLLGPGELYAPDAQRLSIALWPQSRAANVLAQSGRAALTFVFDEAFYQVQLRMMPLAAADATLAYFIGSIETGEAQRVGYARLTGGILFELGADSAAVLARWEQQIGDLKRAADAATRGG